MFKSFYLAGFECATGVNAHGEWIDQLRATEHDRRATEDYALLADAGIRTVREGVRWPLVDRGGRYDFDALTPFVRAARELDMEVIWDLFHYGYPADLDPFSTRFAERLAAYAGAVARHLARELPERLLFTPVNEGSYFSWAGGEVGRFAPHERGRGYELKVSLARAAIHAARAIRSECPDARVITVDPVCHAVAAPGASLDERSRARGFNHDVVYQFMDMVAGRLHPELGGRREDLDILGLNYYSTNQWELGRPEEPLAADDPRRVPLSELVLRTFHRYGGEVMISETAAAGDARGPWIDALSRTVIELLAEDVPLLGICLYPVLGMPEWHDRERWTQMGLWDVIPGSEGFVRHPHAESLRALARAQERERCAVRGRRLVGRPGQRGY
jgi:hypothetical protein